MSRHGGRPHVADEGEKLVTWENKSAEVQSQRTDVWSCSRFTESYKRQKDIKPPDIHLRALEQFGPKKKKNKK